MQLTAHRLNQARPSCEVSLPDAYRHHATLNGQRGAVYMAEEDLVGAAHQDLGIDKEIVRSILRDLVFDAEADGDRLSSNYFSLLRDGATGGIWMRPMHFCLHEGGVGFLRVVAQRRNQIFLNQVSNALGDGLVERVSAAFELQGFRCKTEIDLAKFDSALPDIDLLVISEEPTWLRDEAPRGLASSDDVRGARCVSLWALWLGGSPGDAGATSH